jgi:hypothetical protein
MEGPVQDCPNHGLSSSIDKVDSRGTSQLMTNPDTPSTQNTQIVIPVEKRIAFSDLKIPIDRGKIDLVNLNSFDHILKVTSAVVRAEHTPCDLPDFPDGGFIFVTVLLLRAHKAGIGMLG